MTAIDSTETVQTSAASDTNVVNLVYILYLVGFFTGITALVGVIVAYVSRGEASELARSHYNHQIRIFWRGVIFLVAATVLYIVGSIIAMASVGAGMYAASYGSGGGAFGALGIGAFFGILPFALTLFWAVWTIYRCVKGMVSVNKQRAI